jgi:hypothetical protein
MAILAALANGGLPNLVNLVTAVGALGTAAMGLVDTTKLFGGGPSNFGCDLANLESGLVERRRQG